MTPDANDLPSADPTEMPPKERPGAPPHLALVPRVPDASASVVLLTGATGFVGGELLLRLLDRDERRIICLVRAGSDDEARQRGIDRLQTLLGRAPEEAECERLEWLRSDLEKPLLGLADREWLRLCRDTVEIFHCAASVEFDLPLADAQRINVDGVAALLDLARAVGPTFRRFHHVSTAYASGRTRARVDANHLPPDRARHFRNTYERTKARAERLLRKQPDIPVTLYRPSIIAGDTDTGRTDNWNVLYVPMRQIVRGALPFLCQGGKAMADTVGVDFVVDGIIALADRNEQRIQAYHLTADRLAFDVDRYVRHCNRSARAAGLPGRTRVVGPVSWKLRTLAVGLLAYLPARFGRLRKIGMAARQGLRSFRPYLAYTRISVEFDADWEHRFLAEAGIRMPDPDIYLERLLGYALRNDFGRSGNPVRPARASSTSQTIDATAVAARS